MSINVQEAQRRLESAGFAMSDRYVAGATGKGSKWQSAAAAAGKNYQEGVQQAISRNAFTSGVQAAGSSAYDSGVQSKGAANWGTGMQAGGAKYAKNVQKYSAFWGKALSTPRGARRSPANLARMTENVQRFTKLAA